MRRPAKPLTAEQIRQRTQCRIEDAISALEVLRDELAAGTA